MGTDIHLIIQEQNEQGDWVRNKDLELEDLTWRNYDVFAVLGNVRNGVGFAGITTGEEVKPLTNGRGFPYDFVENPDISTYKEYLGDHSYSWCTLQEILDYDWGIVRNICGVVDREFYDEWDRSTPPDSYCGDVGGPNIVVLEDEDFLKLQEKGQLDPEITYYVRIWWQDTVRDRCGLFVKTIEKIAKEVKDPKKVRLVFGFDS